MKPSLAVILLACALAAGCSPTKPYRTDLSPRPDVHGVIPGGLGAELKPTGCVLKDREIAVVEFDDFGNLFNRRQLNCAVEGVAKAAENAAIVLVYVHGWHNSAEPTRDPKADFNEFQKFVVQLAERIPLRKGESPSSSDAPVVGVYVGWRGDSIPSKGVTTPLSYLLTVWDRISAAQDIGHSGGVTELLLRLERIRAANQGTGTRLIAMGHSAGGALLHAAVGGRLIDQAIEDQAIALEASARRDCVPTPKQTFRRSFYPDLLVLVNPAIEAIRLRPYFDLVRRWPHDSGTPPRLYIATSEGDWATRYAFPLSRSLSTVFDSYGDDVSRPQNITAVGHFSEFITHELSRSQTEVCNASNSIIASKTLGEELAGTSKGRLCIRMREPSQEALLLQRCDKSGQCPRVSQVHHLKRGEPLNGEIPSRLPYLNIRVSNAVIEGHNDIWNPAFQDFLLETMTASALNPDIIPSVVPPKGC